MLWHFSIWKELFWHIQWMWFIADFFRTERAKKREKVVFYTSKHKTFWHINSDTPLIHKLYIISGRSSGLLMSRCHIKKSILSMDEKFMAEISCRKNLLQTSERNESEVLIEQITWKKRYWIIFKLSEGRQGGNLCSSNLSFLRLVLLSEKWSESSHYSCRKCHFYR